MPALNRLSPLTLALFLALPTGVCLAEEADDEEALAALYGDAEMVSIATGTAKPVYRAPSVASVITADDIEAMGARNLDEVLESVAGLHVSRSTLTRLDPVYGIRGIATGFNPQTLVLINGIRFGNLHSSGRMPTFRLPLADVQRIEVIRGPGSAVHGADAFAGVINIITKSADEHQTTDFSYRRGSFSTEDASLGGSLALGAWRLGYNVESQRGQGDDERVVDFDLQSALDAVLGTDASLAPGALSTGYDILDSRFTLANDGWTLRYWNWQQDGAGQGAGGAQAIDPVGRVDIDHQLFDTAYDLEISQKLKLGARYSYQATDTRSTFQLLPPGTVVPIGGDGNIDFAAPAGIVFFPDGLLGNPGSDDRIHYAELFAEYSLLDEHRLRLSAGGRREKTASVETKNFGPGVIDGSQPVVDGRLTSVTGTPYIFVQNKGRSVKFLSVQDEWKLAPDWELTAGMRYDDYSDFGSTTNPRLALVWSTAYNLTSKLLYGRAFRAPSFSELYFINNPVGLGNPTLAPESIDTLELAFDYRPSAALQFGLSLFHYKAKDLIEFTPDTNATTRTAQNARDQRGQGFELEMDWKPSDDLTIKANYAYQDSEDAQTGHAIADVPKQKLYANLDYRLKKNWRVGLQANRIMDRERAEGDSRKTVADYDWVDLTLRRQELLAGLDAALSIRNLLDEDAREPGTSSTPDDYPLEGRSAWVELSYRWNR